MKDRIAAVNAKISEAAQIADKSPEDITLIAVSKTKPIEQIEEAIHLGINNIGENYVNEAADKYSVLKPRYKDLKLHFIGHLQSNKAKHIVPIAELIHSVDSISLAKTINRLSEGKITNILLEVNISQEENKFGFNEKEIYDTIGFISENYSNIKIKGLMGMAPFFENPKNTIPYFAKLKKIFDSLNKENQVYLSMGMSGDFFEAICEGSNMIRVGTAIFNSRN